MNEPENFQGLERFDKVDATGEQAMFFAFLDRIEEIKDVVRRRQLSYELLQLTPGQNTLDVGCGLGTATRDLAVRVAPHGRSVGIDMSEAMVVEAQHRADALGIAAKFERAGAEALPLPAGSIHAYRAERLYQHLPDPGKALAEARRVLAPGGRILLIDQDWDMTLLDADDLSISRDVHRAFSGSFVQGAIGRRFRSLLLDAGFRGVEIRAETVTSSMSGDYGFIVDIIEKSARAAAVDGARLDVWVADQRKRIAEDRFFMAMTHFIASATQPGL
jgi:ubiquinone/menaquinone biosynthesis C-methylase UbiE